MGCSAAAAPPLASIPCKNTLSFSITSRTHQKSIKFKPKFQCFQLHCSIKMNSFDFQCKLNTTVSQYLFLSTFSLTLLILRLTSRIMLPSFSDRWRQLIAFSSQAEAELINAPDYLFGAVVAYEDRRFFSHFGVDAIGVARSIWSLSARGGGSTITQQLVKNTFLKNERTLLRKFVEMVLAIALERRITKSRILSTYLCKIYWGRGIYGVESASSFYFGKPPSLLSLGESALLIGMIPAPEVRSPFRDYSRGKTFQARVLKRMVNGRFLDIETAICAMRKTVSLKSEGPDCAEYLFNKGLREPLKLKIGTLSTMKDVWDWERESKIWEVIEEMEKWAMSFRKT